MLARARNARMIVLRATGIEMRERGRGRMTRRDVGYRSAEESLGNTMHVGRNGRGRAQKHQYARDDLSHLSPHRRFAVPHHEAGRRERLGCVVKFFAHFRTQE